MKIHELTQGSPEWLAYRAQHFNASDAPAMMGVSPYKTRAELLRELHTGVAAEADAGQQRRFDNGHRAEALARPLAEEIIGEELYPVVGSDGRFSASFDGLTLDETQGFEHKALNAELKAAFDAAWADRADGDSPGRYLPIYHRVQMEQQLAVSGAERILFMASEWTADGELVEERHCWYYPDAELRAAILNGWAQFERDLAAYVLPESAEPAPVGKAPEALPALRIELVGSVTASNLAEFKATALGAIRAVNRDLKTDQDFADAEKAVKWCGEVESRLKAAKDHALSQTADIERLFRAIDEISAEAKTVRLDLDKLVTRRKTEVKEEAVGRARRALDAHIDELNAEIAPFRLPSIAADFAGTIKGLKSVASMQDKLNGLLAAAKVAAEVEARAIRANVATFRAQAEGLEFLFADLGQLVYKAADDFAAVVSSRIAAHRAAEERRAREKAEAEARAAEQRRQAEELAAARAESDRLEALAEVNRAKAAAEAAASQQYAHQPQQSLLPVHNPAQQPAPDARAKCDGNHGGPRCADPECWNDSPPRADEPATLKLGVICERLGFTVTADFLADRLHIKPAKVEKAARLYTESQFQTICRQLIAHVGAMAELYGAEVPA